MDPAIKRRRFKIKGFRSGESTETVRAAVSTMNGIRRVEIRPSDRLFVEYNLLQVKLRNIDAVLSRLGHAIAPGVLRRIWKAWIGFTEDNMADNLNVPVSPCCSNPHLNERKECSSCAISAHHTSER